MASGYILKTQLTATLGEVNDLIRVIKEDAISESPDMENLNQLRYSDGKYVMSDVLLAKAHCLNGLAALEVKP